VRNERRDIVVFGIPFDGGASRRGAVLGPDGLRQAGLLQALARSGRAVHDRGNLTLPPLGRIDPPHPRLNAFAESAGWTRRLIPMVQSVLHAGDLPVALGGDHTISAGTVAGAAAYARSVGRRQFVLWLDAHPDFNTFDTTITGNMHGVPVAFFCGLPGFEAMLGHPLEAAVSPTDVMMIGIRSVDEAEQELLTEHGVDVRTAAEMRRSGIEALLRPFLRKVADAGGLLHVSFDVDFLDPDLAPAVSTPVEGGATLTEARRAMELICDSGLMTSLDIVELCPPLTTGDATAGRVVDLASSLFGRTASRRIFSLGRTAA
jgi:arginase